MIFTGLERWEYIFLKHAYEQISNICMSVYYASQVAISAYDL